MAWPRAETQRRRGLGSLSDGRPVHPSSSGWRRQDLNQNDGPLGFSAPSAAPREVMAHSGNSLWLRAAKAEEPISKQVDCALFRSGRLAPQLIDLTPKRIRQQPDGTFAQDRFGLGTANFGCGHFEAE
jgi:hypothetical protein